VDNSGQVVTLRGVFYPSFESACSHQGGITVQQIDQAAARKLLAWNVNFVRIGVSEDCWLGINGQPYGTTVSAYQQALKAWIDLLHADGIYTEIGLMYSAPGTNPSVQQPVMPDEDHAPAFWQSFASYFANEPDTIFGLSGEPKPNQTMRGDTPAQWWNCWLNGGAACTVVYPMAWTGTPYTAAGMQELVNVIRATGAQQPISIDGIHGAEDLSYWLQYEPYDPLNQLVAEWHQYGGEVCFSPTDQHLTNDETCWNQAPATVAAQVPLLNGEVGEQIHLTACAWSFMPTYLTWAEAHNVNYAAFKFAVDDTAGFPCTDYALLLDHAGDPSPVYGQGYYTWLAQH
jgi:hypothetical protein